MRRSYKAAGASARQVLDWYRESLDRDVWRPVGAIRKLGVRTYRADWVSDDFRLRVSATRGETLEEEDSASAAVAQYRVTLRPLD